MVRQAAVLVFACSLAWTALAGELVCDVAVVGGGSAGFAAALATSCRRSRTMMELGAAAGKAAAACREGTKDKKDLKDKKDGRDRKDGV